MTHTQREEGTGPQVLRPSWLNSTHSEVGKGIGSWAQGWALWWYSKARKNVFFFSPISQYLIEGGTKRGKTVCSSLGSLFLRPLSIWLGIWQALGHQRPLRTGPGKPWMGQNSDISMNWRQKQQQRHSWPSPYLCLWAGGYSSGYSICHLR